MAVKIDPTSIKVSVKVFWNSVNALLGDEVAWVTKCRAHTFPTIRLWRQVSMQQPRMGIVVG